MKRILSLLIACAALVLAGNAAAADFKACFVYVGSKTDGGWTQAHDIGRLEAEQYFSGKVETVFVENIAEGPDADRAIERFARSGCDIIFTTSFGFMDPTLKVAKKFRKVKFEHATGYKTADNLTSYNSRFYEGRYIQGQIAAKVSKKGVAGYIASFPIPEVVQGINAFVLGAQTVNPDFKLKVVWVNTWFDAGKEADAAKALIDQGVDILTQHTDSTAPMQVAAERGIYAFGQASDMIAAGPKTQLTAIIDTWGAYYIKRIKAAMDGSWKSQSTWDGLKDGILTMAPYTNMPDDVKAMARETEANIRSGKLAPFTGPINKQDGTPWLKAGERADDGTLLGLNFYVQGVDDKLPQ
jgi:simple sugar transport system substrate-binding protein